MNFNKIINDFYTEFKNLDEKLTGINLAEDKWSLKQIIGHLIDSASNNHQRFVRMQLEDLLNYPDYKTDDWLKIENHNSMDFNDLLLLFVYFNRLIGKIIGNIRPECLQNKWKIKRKGNAGYAFIA